MLKLILPENPSITNYKRIKNPVRKILHLFALRSPHQSFKTHEDTLVGILDMIKGIEYHFKKIKNYEKAACRWVTEIENLSDDKDKLINLYRTGLPRTNHHPASHEAVAYINRVGQLAYFFKSDWFKKNVKEEVIVSKVPAILALQPLRNKYTAHRQDDYPKKDDCSNLGIHQHGLRHGLAYPIGKPKEVRIEYQFPPKQRDNLLKKHRSQAVPDIEYFGGNNNLVIFRPTEVHPIILEQAIDLLEHFLDVAT